VFARVGGAALDWGLPVFDSPRKVADTVLFIGQSLGGEPQVCMLNGYQVRVVSNPDVEVHLSRAFAAGVIPMTSAITSGGHAWYLVHLDDRGLGRVAVGGRAVRGAVHDAVRVEADRERLPRRTCVLRRFGADHGR
jgi:hypothetical protein